METVDYLVDMAVHQAKMQEKMLDELKNAKRKEVPIMKISEMTTANFADFVNAAGDSICNIMQNESVSALFSQDEKRSPIRWMADAAKVLFGPCREDVFAVIGAMHGKSAFEIAQQNILLTLRQLRSVYEDLKAADIPE